MGTGDTDSNKVLFLPLQCLQPAQPFPLSHVPSAPCLSSVYFSFACQSQMPFYLGRFPGLLLRRGGLPFPLCFTAPSTYPLHFSHCLVIIHLSVFPHWASISYKSETFPLLELRRAEQAMLLGATPTLPFFWEGQLPEQLIILVIVSSRAADCVCGHIIAPIPSKLPGIWSLLRNCLPYEE